MPIEIPCKAKYLVRFAPKFGGKKRHAGNSGGTGRTARSTKRSCVISARKSPEQYQQWYKATH